MNFNLEGKRFLVTGAGGGRKIVLTIILFINGALFYVQNMAYALFSFIHQWFGQP